VGDRGVVYRVLVRRHKGEGLLVKTGRRWEDNIKMDLQDVGWGDMDWIDMSED
jgi:hypothetical protein